MGSVSSTITLVDQMSSALADIESSINSMKSTLQSVAGEQTSIDSFNWDKFTQNAEKAGKKIEKIGKQMSVALTTPLIMLGKQMFGDATEYESAYVGMQKTVEGTAEQYEHLNETVLQLSETTPTSYTDLMGIAQTGGNLGVTIDNMETFLKSFSALQAATDQHIAGESGAQLVADFLNITDGGVQNIERFGSSIVDLGNHFNATEDQILGMGKRMAAAGVLAGLSTPEILGMAAAFRSVGINEEAGGSAASKFIKQMQLASEVGGQAQQKLAAVGESFESGLDFSYAIDSMKKSELVSLAESMGMTTEAVKSMADSWVLMDQFAEVSGKTSEQFVKDWSKNPAQAMSDFFTGLSQLGDKGSESILATLDKMGLTEIRESNLIASMAAHPELFASAIETAVAAYAGNTAMWEEFEKQTGTQAAQNKMLGNKLHNTMANFGDNLTKALQPALEMVNKILDAFNNLSETDQTNVLKGLALIAALGPALTIVGGAIKAIAAAMKLISGSGKGAADAVKGVVDAANNADVTGAAGGAAEAGLSTGAKVAGGVTLAAVAYLFAKGAEYRAEHGVLGSVEAIQKATQDNEALRNAFVEWVAANNELNEAALRTDLTPEQEDSIVERQQKAIENFFGLEGAGVLQDLYNDWRSLNNMSLEDWYLPEDFLNWLQSFETPETETPQVEVPEVEVPQPEVETPEDILPEIEIPVIPEVTTTEDPNSLKQQFIDQYGVTDPVTLDLLVQLNITPEDLTNLPEQVTQELQNTEDVSNTASNIGSAAAEGAESNMNSGVGSGIGNAFSGGLAAGILAGRSSVIAAATAVATAAANAARGALGIASPSKVTYWQGTMMIQGYVNALNDGSKLVNNSVVRVTTAASKAWKKSVWGNISDLAEQEAKALEDKFNHVKDGVTVKDSDIKRIRELAEREVINHFTTAEVKVEMNNTNNINKDLDIDGVITKLEDKLTERLEAVAEGVYT